MFRLFLVLHIISGSVALLSGPVAMITVKGGKAHRLFGKIFFMAMTCVFLTAVVLSALKFNPFLLMVAVFSYYLAVTGYRSLYRKQVKGFVNVHLLDWLIVCVAGLFHLGLAAFGAWGIATGNAPSFGWIALVFGMIGCNSVRTDLMGFYRASVDRKRWLYNHISGMMGAYIAAVTAFSAVNMHFVPGIIRWLWPTIIGTPVIIAWIRYYKRKTQVRADED